MADRTDERRRQSAAARPCGPERRNLAEQCGVSVGLAVYRSWAGAGCELVGVARERSTNERAGSERLRARASGGSRRRTCRLLRSSCDADRRARLAVDDCPDPASTVCSIA
uniref:Uncharacterized protein n=1 Tax=Plectus sambesii TaxID=2011161 RepID=A0A914X2K8_9BILA